MPPTVKLEVSMIKLQGMRNECVEIELKETDVIDSVVGIIREKHKLKNVHGLTKGRMFEVVEYHTSHSWTDMEDRGAPTTDQITALGIIEYLENLEKA